MKIGLLCDTHLCGSISSPQHDFLLRAVERMKQDDVHTVIHLGDIAAYGERAAWDEFQNLAKEFNCYILLGNADVRDSQSKDWFKERVCDVQMVIGSRKIVGIHTPDGVITEHDRQRLQTLTDGDILLMHHYPESLESGSRAYLLTVASTHKLTMIHGHKHKSEDYIFGKSRVVGLSAVDPDKAIGNYPCITYLDVSDQMVKVEKIALTIPQAYIRDFADYLGLSCVDNHKDINFAAEHNVRFIELRCNGKDWFPDETLLPKLETWRKKTNGYLSVHMPNLKWNGNEIQGVEQWNQAIVYACRIGANGLTMHPPRVKKVELYQNQRLWDAYVSLYRDAVNRVPEDVKIGIENVHMAVSEHELPEENLEFGYTPPEVSLWIDTINRAVNKQGRVGHVLDVGHARNNGYLASVYPVGRWYELMGERTVAYHIHQVVRSENGLKNHRPIENWFGPMISYVSFFYAWGKGMLNHVPVFLEVRGAENYEKSLEAFRCII